MEKFRVELLWPAGLLSALCDEFPLAKEGFKLLKKHHVLDLQAVFFKTGERGTIYSALK